MRFRGESDPKRPGWRTTEFWLSLLAVIVAYLLTTDLGEGDDWVAKGLAIVATVLASLGYTASRTLVKRSAIASE